MKYELSPLERAYLEYKRLYLDLKKAEEEKDGQKIQGLRKAIGALRSRNGLISDAQTLLAHAERVEQAILKAETEEPLVDPSNGS